jgi:hypothetical protein
MPHNFTSQWGALQLDGLNIQILKALCKKGTKNIECYVCVIGFPEGGTPGKCGDLHKLILQSLNISPPMGQNSFAKAPPLRATLQV